MRARFNRDCLVNDVPLNLRSRRQPHLQAPDFADHTTIYDDIIRHHFTFDHGGFTDRQQMRANIAFDLTFNLDITRRAQIALDAQVR